MTYDFIGDIHGYAEALQRLLEKLGYRKKDGVYSHPKSDRIAIFLGDYIDRGPEIRETLKIVRSMVDSKRARAILGNHEYNAVCFHAERSDMPGVWIRERSDKNLYQHLETLYQFAGRREELGLYLDWFKTLPVWLDLGGVKAVHAAWHEPSIEALDPFPDGGRYISKMLLDAVEKRGSEAYNAIEILLKGVEINLPPDVTFTDRDGNERRKMRAKWWLKGTGKSYGELTFRQHAEIEDAIPVTGDTTDLVGYNGQAPVFFGHYRFKNDTPSILTPKIACLDYSVDTGGYLAAYTWSGEKLLSDGNFTVV
jgi:hypothetical protein